MSRRLPRRAWICLGGFLLSLILIGAVLAARRQVLLQATTTSYTALSGEAQWEGDWEIGPRGADPSQAGSLDGSDRVTIPFQGTGLALRVRRGDYRGYFYVTVDGQPANRLPRDERGAYLVLTSPDRTPEVTTIPVAGGLDQGGHVARVVAARGWDQWPLVGWRVASTPGTTLHRWALVGLGAAAAALLTGAIWWGRRALVRREPAPPASFPLPAAGPLGRARAGALVPLAVLAAAAAFYASPWPPLTALSGLALAALVVLRLDAGLALVAASAPFYLQPRPLLGKAFSMVEIATLLCLLSWAIRWLVALRRQRPDLRRLAAGLPCSLTGLDWAAAAFVALATLSILAADHRHVALREWRVLIVEPALLYLMLRTSRLDRRAVWRLVDLFVVGAVAVAVIGLVQYALGVNLITAEEGFRRLRSVYGSPNSVGLYLGRALPVLAAVALFGAHRRRRAAYGLALVPLGLATLLSFSKGALLLGVPLSLVALGLLAGGRWLWGAVGATVAAILAAIPLLRTPRFAALLDPRSGTIFFRLQIWKASWRMFLDHPWLGVGPDNFLYHYRSRYILPVAWQEPDISQAHDVVLDYATRMGVPGLAVGAWLQVAFWRAALPLRRLSDPDRRALALGLMGSMANFLAHGLVDASYFLIDLAFVFFLTLGLVQWLAGEGESAAPGA